MTTLYRTCGCTVEFDGVGRLLRILLCTTCPTPDLQLGLASSASGPEVPEVPESASNLPFSSEVPDALF